VEQAGVQAAEGLLRDRMVARPVRFTQPLRQVFLMLVVVGLVAVGTSLVYPQLAPIFLTSPWLNGTIAAIFVVGVLSCFLQVFQVGASARWIKGFAEELTGHETARAPSLLAPLAALLSTRGARMAINPSSARSILDSVATRLDESRDITRYIINLLVFLGLLGTFYGLAMTVPAVVETIRSLNPREGEDGMQVFGRLMTGLEAQLGGMGTAFATSLLGLAGSLVVGLLELFAGHGQNRFYRELEEWLSTITRLGFSAGDGEGTAMDRNVARVLDYMVEQMEALQGIFIRADARTAGTEAKIEALTGAVADLARQIEARSEAEPRAEMRRLAEAQERLAEALEARAAQAEDGSSDAELRMHLRSIDMQLLRLGEEIVSGRQETLAELRGDVAQLTRAVRQSARELADRGAGLPPPPRRRG